MLVVKRRDQRNRRRGAAAFVFKRGLAIVVAVGGYLVDARGSQSAVADDAVSMARSVERYIVVVRADSTDLSALAKLKAVLRQRALEPSEVSRSARNLVRMRTRAAFDTLVPAGEPGLPLEVKGLVRDPEGRPVSGALLYVFQADAAGHYTDYGVMNEPNARLFGFMRTDSSGAYAFRTIRPGGYPVRPEEDSVGRRIPEHIHFEITAPGFAVRRLQMVFDDDPRMQPEHWRTWAEKAGHPVVSARADSLGVLQAVCDIRLRR